MPKLTLLTWGFLILSTSLMGQNLDEFNRLVSKGDLPQDLAMSLEELQAEHHVNPEFKPNNPNERYLGHREQLNNALTREYLMGGDALFGDDVTVYLNEIAQVLLEDYPDWQDRIEVYSYRGMIGSAVSLENGRIFFNLEVLAQLQDESQVAFLLAREIEEIMDYQPLELKRKEITRTYYSNLYNQYEHIVLHMGILGSRGYYSRLSDEEIKDLRYNYHHRLDSAALEMIENTGKYSQMSLKTTFDVLKYLHMPLFEIELNPLAIFENGLAVPDSAYLDSVRTIDAERSMYKRAELNAYAERKEALETIRDRKEYTNYIDTKERFEYVRDLCRFETLNIFIENGRYLDALYNAQYLLQSFPNNAFLNKIQGQAIFYIAQLKENDMYEDHADGYTHLEGDIYVSHAFFKGMSKEACHVYALRKLYSLNQEYPESEDIAYMLGLTKNTLINSYGIDALSFSLNPETVAEETSSDEDESSEEGSKYDRLKNMKEKQEGNRLFSTAETVRSILFKDDANDINFASFVEERMPLLEPVGELEEDMYGQLSGERILWIDSKDFELVSDHSASFENEPSKELFESAKSSLKRVTEFETAALNWSAEDEDARSTYNELVILRNYIRDLAMQKKFNETHAGYSPYTFEAREILNKYNCNYAGILRSSSLVYKMPHRPGVIAFGIPIYPLGILYLLARGSAYKDGALSWVVVDSERQEMIDYGVIRTPESMNNKFMNDFFKDSFKEKLNIEEEEE